MKKFITIILCLLTIGVSAQKSKHVKTDTIIPFKGANVTVNCDLNVSGNVKVDTLEYNTLNPPVGVNSPYLVYSAFVYMDDPEDSVLHAQVFENTLNLGDWETESNGIYKIELPCLGDSVIFLPFNCNGAGSTQQQIYLGNFSDLPALAILSGYAYGSNYAYLELKDNTGNYLKWTNLSGTGIGTSGRFFVEIRKY